MTVSNATAYPGWLDRKDMESSAWQVQEGAPIRGDAWTDIDGKRMRVPMGDDELSRAVRFHEMVHAKVSPSRLIIPDWMREVDPGLVAACEEVRVNILAKHAGADVDKLEDGSEKRNADLLVRSKNTAGLTNLIVSTFGTKVNNTVMRSIKKTAKELNLPAVTELAMSVRKTLMDHTKWVRKGHESYFSRYADTTEKEVTEDGKEVTMPRGYEHTLSLAQALSRFSKQSAELPKWLDPKPGDKTGPEVSIGSDGAKFAVPIVDKLSLTERIAGRMGRKRIATDIGTNPRRIARVLTDPDRRIFDRRARGLGGVVLIDQSGSMRLDTDDIWSIIKAAPGCTIIGYSHAPGSSDVPNIWVMAENGRVVKTVPSGNGGNGVDGPALLFGISKRKKGEPFVWVCDGHVTNAHDNQFAKLDEQCVKLVAKHNIHMTPDVDGAVKALKSIDRGDKLETTFTGPLRTTVARLNRKEAA